MDYIIGIPTLYDQLPDGKTLRRIPLIFIGVVRCVLQTGNERHIKPLKIAISAAGSIVPTKPVDYVRRNLLIPLRVHSR